MTPHSYSFDDNWSYNWIKSLSVIYINTFNCAVFITVICTIHNCFNARQRSCGKVIFSVLSVCHSDILSVHRGSCTGSWHCSPTTGSSISTHLCTGPSPTPSRHVKTCSTWNFLYGYPPRHCYLCSMYCQQEGIWKLTEMRSCFLCLSLQVGPDLFEHG